MRRHRLRCVAVLSVAVVALWTTSACADDSNPRIVIRLGHIGTPGSHFDLAPVRFKELTEARLPDRVEVRLFPSSQLGEDREMLDGLRVGTLEMHVTSSVLHSVEPLLGIFDLPFAIEDRAQFERLVDGTLGDQVKMKLLDRGLVLLGFWENGFRVITNNVRPIITPADLQGIKLRTPKNPERMKMFEAFGADPASMPFSELFTGAAVHPGWLVDEQLGDLNETDRVHE